MKCPQCGAEGRPNELYCGVCGAEIRLTYDELHAVVTEEIKEDKETATEQTMRMVLLWMGFFLIASLTVQCASTGGLVGEDNPEQAYHIPLYSTKNDTVLRTINEDRTTDTVAEVEKMIEDNLKRVGLKTPPKAPPPDEKPK